jgi:SAM-dependent methyltransferase
MTRRGDFSAQAAAYGRARPGYPGALVDRLLTRAGVATGDAVADFGAGTGRFTVALAARGLRVTAIEPSAAMRAEAPAMTGVRWQAGTFEETGLADASQGWVVAAHAFHWADPVRALPELRRVLTPASALSVIWNVRDEEASEVLSFTRARIEEMAPGFDEGYRARDWAAVLTSTGDFEGATFDEEPHAVPMSAARFLALWESHHLLRRAIGDDGLARLKEELERALDGRDVEVPYRCRSWTARRA